MQNIEKEIDAKTQNITMSFFNRLFAATMAKSAAFVKIYTLKIVFLILCIPIIAVDE